MTTMRDKLARLEQLRRARGDGVDVAAARVGAASRGELVRLATVQAQLDHALGVIGAGRPPPAEGQWVEPLGVRLPFLPQRTSRGLVHVQQARLPLAERFGVMPLGAALTADARLLALLALSPALGAVPLAGALFVDTETSGLGGGTGNVAFLVGMSWFDAESDQLVLEQLLLRDPDDEAAMLARVCERI